MLRNEGDLNYKFEIDRSKSVTSFLRTDVQLDIQTKLGPGWQKHKKGEERDTRTCGANLLTKSLRNLD